ncbi:hypothetical protein B0J12DRAFT_761571 [Macrophomina phaseolina]|uniref:Uncharacterized protein n=1 Tax=Macrophomina phaseolina TaxID=35725 RepID=A0ABQ8G4N0_9PEZI|nr:hypothetical protein B0J12DRAFT_761571 [Macrophomina phaseolina]
MGELEALLHRSVQSPAAIAFEERLSADLIALGISVSSADLSKVDELAGKAVTSRLEIEEPFVIGWDEAQFEQFRELTAAKYLLWIAHGGFLEAGETSLSFAPTTGLLRTICLPHLDLSSSTDLTSERAIELTVAALQSNTKALTKGKENETKFAVSGGILHMARARADHGIDKDMELNSTNVRSVFGQLHNTHSDPGLEARKAGKIDSARWIECENPNHQLSTGGFELRVSHITLQESVIRTSTDGAEALIFGREVVGVVVIRVGAGVVHLQPGDRVSTLQWVTLSTHVRKGLHLRVWRRTRLCSSRSANSSTRRYLS